MSVPGPKLDIYTLEEKYAPELITKFMVIILANDDHEAQALVEDLSEDERNQFDQYLAELETIRAEVSADSLDAAQEGLARIELANDAPTQRTAVLTAYRSFLNIAVAQSSNLDSDVEMPDVQADDSVQANAEGSQIDPDVQAKGGCMKQRNKKCVVM